jgi:hypothetical protein
MREYPWNESIEAMDEFERKRSNWYLSIPDLPPNDVKGLVDRWCDRRLVCAINVLGSLLGDQPKVPKKNAEKAFKYILDVHYNASAAAAALALRPEVDVSTLAKLLEVWGKDGCVHDHVIGNLARRAASDPEAKKRLRKIFREEQDLTNRQFIADRMNWKM